MSKFSREPSTSPSRASETFAKHSESRARKWKKNEAGRTATPTSGYRLMPLRRSRKSNRNSKAKWQKLVSLRFSMSSTSSGETSWERRMMQSRRNSPSKFRIWDDSSSPKKLSTRMSHKERYQGWKRSSNLSISNFITRRDRPLPVNQMSQCHPTLVKTKLRLLRPCKTKEELSKVKTAI